jgi:hypothetical protein
MQPFGAVFADSRSPQQTAATLPSQSGGHSGIEKGKTEKLNYIMALGGCSMKNW